MEFRIPLLAKKLYKTHKGMTPGQFFGVLRTSPHYKALFDTLDPKDIVILCFLVGNMTEGSDMKSLYDEIIQNLFVFSLVYVTDEESLETCHYCGGDGEVTCGYCEGDGEVDCEDCGGDGEDDEGEDCDYCNGGGKVSCDNCRRGYEQCDYCEGSGETVRDGYKDVTQEYFVSFSRALYNYFETKIDELEEVPNKNYDSIIKNKKTFMTFEESGASYEFEDFMSGDYVFVGMDKEDVSFYKRNQFLNPQRIGSFIS